MPKHHHHKGEGVKLAGNPEAFIRILVKEQVAQEHVIDQVTNEGPKHKQVLTALLLHRLHSLVHRVEKSSGQTFVLQNGLALWKEKDGRDLRLPVDLPVNVEAGFNKEKLAEAASHAPEHEALAYAMALQVIEWAIKTIPDNSRDN